MKKPIYAVVAFILGAGIFTQCNQPAETHTKDSEPEVTEADKVEHGKYLVYTMGCGDCHSPKKMTDRGPVPDMDRWLMGHPANDTLPAIDYNEMTSGQWILFNPGLTASVGPWGTSYAANLTPDPSGIGSWSLEQFKKAMTEGKFKGMDDGRPIMPPMPWQNFKDLTDKDLQDIFAYLNSIKPIENVVPAYMPPAKE